MLCHVCRVHVRRDFPYCLHCGTLRRRAKVTEFVAPVLRGEGVAFDITGEVTSIGRDPANALVLDDASVSRRHAEVRRDAAGFRIRDLGSLNGTSVGGRPTDPAGTVLVDGVVVHVGDVELTFEQPRSVAIGSRTFAVTSSQTQLAVAAERRTETATEPLSARPRRRSGWALKQVPDERGERRWVLRNTRTGHYLQLAEREVFIWNQLDGDATIRDLLFAYAQRYGELALPRIERTLKAFDAAGLLRGLSDHAAADDAGWLRRIGRRVLHGLTRLELSIGGIDRLFDRLYQAGAWRFFTRTGVLLLWLAIIGGAIEFTRAQGHQRLFDIGGAGVWGAVALGLVYLAALVVHESAHALAVKSYGRRVTRGGFMMMMGMPFAFVDTSDMWFGSRWSRIVVTLSGPLSSAALAGICATVAAEAPQPVVAGMAYQLCVGLYLNTLYNFNPLMPLDGYQALADALRVPRLREEAMGYACRGFWQDVAHRRRPGWRGLGLLGYGAAALVCTYVFLLLGIRTWNGRIGTAVDRHIHPPWNVLLIVAVIGLVMFPVWYRLGRKGVLLARRVAARRARAQTTAVAAEAEAAA
jgi:putative peptide zinc metalloprotease protein